LKRLVLPRLYVILDAALLTVPESECTQELVEAGVRLLQYRNKKASALKLFECSKRLSSLLTPQSVTFVVNDRADVACAAEASGVHVGQEDLEAEAARLVIGTGKLLGVSTHTLEQFEQAAAGSADYIAVGPVFTTSTKANPDPVVGIELIRRVRLLTDKPIVAIGGITLERAGEVIQAGANSVAVASDILLAPNLGQRARNYIDLLGTAKQAAGQLRHVAND
jgi:thiamine-phosphate pyrophosphorylase